MKIYKVEKLKIFHIFLISLYIKFLINDYIILFKLITHYIKQNNFGFVYKKKNYDFFMIFEELLTY